MNIDGTAHRKNRVIIKPGLVLIGLLSSFLFAGCIYDPVYHGPPPPGYYHPHYYDYYYYPRANVYFQFSTGFYFYLTNGVWIKARVLPRHIIIDPYDRVRIRVDSDRPYTRYEEHRSRFKPRPIYHKDERKTRSIKEKEANREWYREYEKVQKKPKKDKKDTRKKMR
jgi:hypothetical protein